MSQRIDNRVYRDKHGFVIVYIVKDDCYVYADTCEALPYYPSANTRKTWERIGTNLKFTD
ncbi:hypothetical protein [Klebsiella phage 175007]|uniref:Uncharacterized protein n=1 Tax=Klebsiella phage 175007 TaxID=3127743 RepID=A0ABZ2I5K6_9CAUD